MRSETIRFEEIKQQASKSLPCSLCGKRVRRSKTFMQTLNPYNRNADGQPKTVREIYAELREKADEWREEAVMCTACESLPLRSETYPAELPVDRIEAALGHLDADPNEPLIDPDCRDGKCGSCVGGLCEHECHDEEATSNE